MSEEKRIATILREWMERRSHARDGMPACDLPPPHHTTCDHEKNTSNPQTRSIPRQRGKACGATLAGWTPHGGNSDRILRGNGLQTPQIRLEGVACGKDADMGSGLSAAVSGRS